MAGHSKWANIQHRKKAQDVKRGKLFTRLIREITVSARMGGSDIAANPRLRAAVDKALSANMTKDTVERAIKRGAGELDDIHYEEIRYEGYGPGGAAVIVDCMTDNRNRTAGEVRHAFTKHGGNLGANGSVAYLFQQVGIIQLPPGIAEEDVMEAAIEAGAEDVVRTSDDSLEIITDPLRLINVKDQLVKKNFVPVRAEIIMRASNVAALDEETGEKFLGLIEALEELDDVQNVYFNADLPETLLDDETA